MEKEAHLSWAVAGEPGFLQVELGRVCQERELGMFQAW